MKLKQLVAIFTLIVTHSVSKEKLVVEKQEESLRKKWETIYKVWCHPQNLPDEVIDDAYDCFGNATTKEDFELQLKCENAIFPDSMSKNDVRRAMCKNDAKIIAKFDKCFAANKKVNKSKKLLPKEEQKKQDMADFQKLSKLVINIRTHQMDDELILDEDLKLTDYEFWFSGFITTSFLQKFKAKRWLLEPIRDDVTKKYRWSLINTVDKLLSRKTKIVKAIAAGSSPVRLKVGKEKVLRDLSLTSTSNDDIDHVCNVHFTFDYTIRNDFRRKPS